MITKAENPQIRKAPVVSTEKQAPGTETILVNDLRPEGIFQRKLINIIQRNQSQEKRRVLQKEEDASKPLLFGQIEKEIYISTLKSSTIAMADGVLSKIGQTSQNCPYIQYWFSVCAAESPELIETYIRRYAPDTEKAATWQENISIVVEKIKQGLEQNIQGGSLEGVPAEVPKGLVEEPAKETENAADTAQLCPDRKKKPEIQNFKTNQNPDDEFDDDLDTIEQQLPALSDNATVRNYIQKDNHNDVVLCRGCDDATIFIQSGSAGGGADTNIARPSREESRQQVGKGGRLPEFASQILGFSRGGYLVYVSINTRYLQIGSGTEGGFTCYPQAPLEVIAVVDRTAAKKENRFGNAS